jgi:hypothetical protein
MYALRLLCVYLSRRQAEALDMGQAGQYSSSSLHNSREIYNIGCAPPPPSAFCSGITLFVVEGGAVFK